LLHGADHASPPASYRVEGQRIPREPHRFSGRTAMNTHVHVSEPKPPEDPDSSLSYTMEGYRGMPPSSMIPFFWAPGWNSVQSVNKYQQSVGGPLRGGDPGVRLFEPVTGAKAPYFLSVPEKFISLEDHLLVVPLHHIFGSEELSVHAPAVAARAPEPYVMVSAADAEALKLGEGQVLAFEVEGQPYRLPVRISHALPKGAAGLPYGLQGLPFVELPAWGILKM